jgi:hypothetical protein
MHKKSLLAVVSGLVLAMATYNALAITCTTTITGKAITGGVDVPASTGPDTIVCTLIDVTVIGNVTVGADSALLVCNSKILGNVLAVDSNDVHLGEVHGADCPGNSIAGSVTIQGAGGAELDSSTVNGPVTFTNNDAVDVEGNVINGSLQCSGNTFITNSGEPNTVNGPKTGQCANL